MANSKPRATALIFCDQPVSSGFYFGKILDGIEGEAYDSDSARIVSASGDSFMATCFGESEQGVFKPRGRPTFERSSAGKKPPRLSLGTPHSRSRRHVPDSRPGRATAP